MIQHLLLATLCFSTLFARSVPAQTRAVVELERRDFAEWLRSAPLSPHRAVGVFPLGGELTLGPPGAAVPLAGIQPAELTERGGRVTLRIGSESRPVARGRAIALGNWRLLLSGAPGRGVVTVFGAERKPAKEAEWYPYDEKLVLRATLAPARSPAAQRLLAPDGTEVEATDAGRVEFRLGGITRSLLVRRLPGASDEETELEVFFQDATNDRATYPAGRFVSLLPQPGGGYLLDLNRARNPFCAYNTAYPCPAPWRGNRLPVAVPAGERYRGVAKPPGS